MVQFCYLILYFGIDNVSRCLLQWIARIKNGLKLRPTTRYRAYNNRISTRFWSDNESAEEGDYEVIYRRTCMAMSGRSVRDHDWCVWIHEAAWCRTDGYTTYIFSYYLNCTSGRFHVNLYLDFSGAYHQKWLTWWRKKNSDYDEIIFAAGKWKVNG